jgi:tRNA G18 (ribose-2'-O)-methylase SpoU
VTEAIQRRGYTVIAADLDGPADLARLALPEHTVVALGSEAAGLSPALRQLAQARCALPMNREKAESLNVAVCGAIYLYLVCGQQRSGPPSGPHG